MIIRAPVHALVTLGSPALAAMCVLPRLCGASVAMRSASRFRKSFRWFLQVVRQCEPASDSRLKLVLSKSIVRRVSSPSSFARIEISLTQLVGCCCKKHIV
jgi:hypothetical protein